MTLRKGHHEVLEALINALHIRLLLHDMLDRMASALILQTHFQAIKALLTISPYLSHFTPHLTQTRAIIPVTIMVRAVVVSLLVHIA